MPFILRTENDQTNPTNADVYGKQITAGKLVYYLKQNEVQKGILFLGAGEMDGIDQILYNGEVLDNASWKFHSGKITSQINPFDVTAISGDTITLASNPFQTSEPNVIKEIVTATGGTRTISIIGTTTVDLAYNASASTIQSALNSAFPYFAGSIAVSNPSAGVYKYTFVTGDAGVTNLMPYFTVNTGSLTGGTSVFGRTDEVALVAGVDPVTATPTFPVGVAQHQKLYVVYSSGNNIKLSTTSGGVAINWSTQMASPTISAYLLANLKVYSADKGYFDPEQGRPSFFPELNYTFSGISYVEFSLNTTLSAVSDEPTDFKIFVRGKRLQNYTGSGALADASGVAFPDQQNLPTQTKFFSANNALVALDIMLNSMQIKSSRIDWASWAKFRDYCDESIEWNSGSTTTLSTPTWTHQNTIEEGVGNLRKTNAYSASVNAASLSVQSHTLTDDSNIIRYKGVYRNGAQGHGITDLSTIPGTITPSNYTCRFGINSQGIISIHANKNGTAVFTGTSTTAMNFGESFEIIITKGLTSTTYEVYRSDTLLHSGTITSGGNGALRAMSDFGDEDARVTDLKLFPIPSVIRHVNRFDAHLVFPSQISSVVALEQVMARSPNCHWQDVNGKIKFIVGSTFKDLTQGQTPTDGDRVLVKLISYDPTQSSIPSNIVKDSFSSYKKPSIDKQNFLRTEFRDIEDQYFTKKYSFTDRPQLRDYVRSLVDFGVVQIGVANQSLSDRMSEAIMRWNSDLDLFIKFTGFPDTISLAKGDLIKFAHEVPNWTIDEAPIFCVIDEVEDPSTAGERSFTLQVYSDEFYSDTDHGPITASLPSSGGGISIPPPKPLSVDLEELGETTGEGVYIPIIHGTITFDTSYGARQRARIYWKKPDETEFTDTGIIKEQPTYSTSTMTFDLNFAPVGTNEVKVITESISGVPSLEELLPIPSIDIVGTDLTVPDPPTDLVGTLSQGIITWRWVEPVSNPLRVAYYRITDGSGVAVTRQGESGLSWSEPAPMGVTSVSRRVYSVSSARVVSTSYASASITLSPPSDPSGYTITFDGEKLLHRWTSPATFQGRQFEIASDAGFTTILWRGTDAKWDETRPTSAGTVTRYLRITNTVTGLSSNAVSATYNVAAPNAPTSLTGVYDGTSIKWNWTGSTSLGVVGYRIYSNVGLTTLLGTVDGTIWIQPTVSGTTTYQIYVVAVAENGLVSSALTTSYSVPVPSAPTNLVASYNGIVIDWGWTASTSPGVNGYKIYRDAAKTQLLATVDNTVWSEPTTSGQDSSEIFIFTTNNLGQISTSYLTDIYEVGEPNPPTSVTGTYNGDGIDWNWTASTTFRVTGYKIYNHATSTSPANLLAVVDGTQWSQPTTLGTSSYQIWVRAYNDSNLLSTAAAGSFNASAPAQPTSLTSSWNGNSIQWNWTASVTNPKQVGYKIYSNSGLSTLLATVQGTQWIQPPSTATTPYSIWITAFNPLIENTSSPLTGTFTEPTPNAPTSLTGTYNGATVDWNWVASTTSTVKGYKIYSNAGLTNLLATVDGTQWSQPTVSTQASYQIYVVAYQPLGTLSTSITNTATIGTPSAPSGYTITWASTRLIHNWTASGNYLYTIRDGANTILWQGYENSWNEVLSSFASASFTRKIEATNSIGLTSSQTTANFTAPTLSAPSSVSFISGTGTPFDVSVDIVAPAGLVRENVVQTLVEVVDTTNTTVLYPMIFSGVAEVATVSGRYLNATNTIKVRASYKDVFGRSTTSTVTSTTYNFGQLSNGSLEPIGMAAFASGIRPPRIITGSSLPALPDSPTYIAGDTVYWVGATSPSDRKIWRTETGLVGSGAPYYSWTKAIDAVDLVANSITAGQIAAGAIGADQIAANAIRATHLAVGLYPDNLIINSSFENTRVIIASDPEYNTSIFTVGSVVPSGWMYTGSSGNPFTASSSFSTEGSYSLRLGTATTAVSTAFPAVETTTYIVSFKIMVPSGATNGGNITIGAYESTANIGTNRYIGSLTDSTYKVVANNTSQTFTNTLEGASESFNSLGMATLASGGVWLTKECQYTPTAGTKYVSFFVMVGGTPSHPVYLDEVIIRKKFSGVLIENGTIYAQNLAIGGLSDNLILNSSFEQLDRAGFPQNWAYDGTVGASSYLIPGTQSKALQINNGQAATSRVIPVQPGKIYAVRFSIWSSSSFSNVVAIKALFRTVMPTTGTERQKNYITQNVSQTNTADTTLTLGSTNYSVTTTKTAYEVNITVPSNMYWMSLSPTTTQTPVYVDEVLIKEQLGSAFISQLRVSQLVANVGEIGLIFADEIRQQGHIPYQSGSTYTADLGFNYNTGTVTYDKATDLLTLPASFSSATQTITATQNWQIIKAHTDGYVEAIIPKTGISATYWLGLTGNYNPGSYSAGSKYTVIDYAWSYDAANNLAYIYHAGSSALSYGGLLPNDTLRVAVEGDYVRFRRNGILVYTSPYKPTVSTPRGAVNPSFRGVFDKTGSASVQFLSPVLVQGGIGKGWRLNPGSSTTLTTSEPVWSTTYNAGTFSSDINIGQYLTASSNNAVRVTEQTINSGDGFVQCKIENASGSGLLFGLTSNGSFSSSSYSTITYGIYIDLPGEFAQAYVNGSGYSVVPVEFGNTFRVSIEGTTVKFRRNGTTFYEIPSVDITSFTNTYPFRGKFIMSNTNKVTEIGFAASSSSLGEFNEGITVKGFPITAAVDRIQNALRVDNRYKGNDIRIPSNVVTSINMDSYQVSWEDDVWYADLSATFTDYKTNVTKGLDSLKHVRVRVYNKYGEMVKTTEQAYHGRGSIFSGYVSRDACDGKQEAVFSVEFENLFGYSSPLWYSTATWFNKSGYSGWVASNISSNISFTQPTWLSRYDSPSQCIASAASATSVNVSWAKSVNLSGTNHKVMYRIFKPKGYGTVAEEGSSAGWSDGIASTSAVTGTITSLLPNTRYEIAVRVNSSSSPDCRYEWSNLAYVRTPSTIVAPVYGAPSGLSASASSSSQVDITWVKNDTANYVETELYFVAGTGFPTTQIGTSLTGTTYSHTGRSAGTTYTYVVRNKYTGSNYSEWSAPFTVTTPASAVTPFPIGFNVYSDGYYSLVASWTNYSGYFSAYLQVAYSYDTSFASPVYTNNSATSATNVTGLLSGTDYIVRTSHNGTNWIYAYVTTQELSGGGSGGTGCLPEGQKVKVVNSEGKITDKSIEDLEIGDVVIGTNVDDYGISHAKVIQVRKIKAPYLLKITTDDGNTVICSPSHRIITSWIDETGTEASTLLIGQYILTYDNINIKESFITAIEKIDKPTTVYKLSLDSKDHTYVGGGILAHNAKPMGYFNEL